MALHDSSISDEARSHIQRDLLAWFDREQRDLPWRKHRHPYGTWISEVMLQQTTVKTVIPYYERFLERFPDVATLAAAPLDDVLSLWSGLGYYRRARHLHAAALHVMEELGGRLPTERKGWSALPGVGDYASGAIASMALGEVVPALDANAQRVLLRWAVEDPAELDEWKPARRRHLAESMVDPERPGDWNEAVMELGALVCPAGPPRCPACPVWAHCRAGRSGQAPAIGLSPSKIPPVNVVGAQLVVLWRGKILLLAPENGLVLAGPEGLEAARSDFGNLHQGFWSLPLTGWYDRETASPIDWSTPVWADQVAQALGLESPPGQGDFEMAGTCRHAITRYRIQAQTWVWRLPENAPVGLGEAPGGRFVGPGDGNPPVSRLVTKGLSVAGLTMG